jgi:hypothetical protein
MNDIWNSDINDIWNSDTVGLSTLSLSQVCLLCKKLINRNKWTNPLLTSVWNKLPGWVVNHSQFFFWLLRNTFPTKSDVWGRLCSHFAAVKVMTFASVTASVALPQFRKIKRIKIRNMLWGTCSISLPRAFFYFFEKPREGRRKDLVLLEVIGLCAESVGVGCQRAPIALIRYPVWTSHQVWHCERVYIHFRWNKKCVRDIHLMKFYLFCLPQHRHLLPCFPLPPHFMCSNK